MLEWEPKDTYSSVYYLHTETGEPIARLHRNDVYGWSYWLNGTTIFWSSNSATLEEAKALCIMDVVGL
jgi:hypothetical protein